MAKTSDFAWLCVAAAALLLGCDSEPVRESGHASASTGPGQVLYLTYCESCHGPTGEGNGRAAASLRQPPTDLTRLSERYGTPLDRERIAGYIDGRLILGVHGAREMPIWGEEFFADAPSDTPNLEAVRRRLIDVLIEHLQSLQREQTT